MKRFRVFRAPLQQQSDKTALKVNRLGGMFARKPHYELPAELTDASLTLLLQQPLKLHDMQVVHVTIERVALVQWLDKGGEIRGKLNGIGFAQPLSMEVDSKPAPCDPRRQPSGIAPGAAGHGL